jgi:hypothetical protein
VLGVLGLPALIYGSLGSDLPSVTMDDTLKGLQTLRAGAEEEQSTTVGVLSNANDALGATLASYLSQQHHWQS